MPSSKTSGAGALQSLFGAAAAVCRGEMDLAEWMISDAGSSGLSSAVLNISPVVVKNLLTLTDPPILGGDAGVLTMEFVVACHGKFPYGTTTIGTLCLQAAAGQIDPWYPELAFALDLDVTVPVWGAVACTWFAAEQLAYAYGADPATASERICLSIASHI